MPSTLWELEYEAEIEEIAEALKDEDLYPHTWPISGEAREWNPKPE